MKYFLTQPSLPSKFFLSPMEIVNEIHRAPRSRPLNDILFPIRQNWSTSEILDVLKILCYRKDVIRYLEMMSEFFNIQHNSVSLNHCIQLSLISLAYVINLKDDKYEFYSMTLLSYLRKFSLSFCYPLILLSVILIYLVRQGSINNPTSITSFSNILHDNGLSVSDLNCLKCLDINLFENYVFIHGENRSISDLDVRLRQLPQVHGESYNTSSQTITYVGIIDSIVKDKFYEFLLLFILYCIPRNDTSTQNRHTTHLSEFLSTPCNLSWDELTRALTGRAAQSPSTWIDFMSTLQRMIPHYRPYAMVRAAMGDVLSTHHPSYLGRSQVMVQSCDSSDEWNCGNTTRMNPRRGTIHKWLGKNWNVSYSADMRRSGDNVFQRRREVFRKGPKWLSSLAQSPPLPSSQLVASALMLADCFITPSGAMSTSDSVDLTITRAIAGSSSGRRHTVVMLGDGDFSFTAALLRHIEYLNDVTNEKEFGTKNTSLVGTDVQTRYLPRVTCLANISVVATSRETREALRAIYPSAASNTEFILSRPDTNVCYEVDIFREDSLPNLRNLNTIVFNFPFADTSTKQLNSSSFQTHWIAVGRHKQLLHAIFKSSRSLFRADESGRDHKLILTLLLSQAIDWQLEDVSRHHQFHLEEMIPFFDGCFERFGYCPRRTNVDSSFSKSIIQKTKQFKNCKSNQTCESSPVYPNFPVAWVFVFSITDVE